MKIVPVVFKWLEVELVDADGVAQRIKAMVPHPRYGKVAARQFVDAEEYPMVILETRSRASHSHYFAALQEAYDNLPEKLAARWQSMDHFRKWCLIEQGWFHEDEHNFDTEQDAKTFAKRLTSFARAEDVYIRMWQTGVRVIVRRAKSQSAHAMAKDAFEASKKSVLELASLMVGIDRPALEKHAKRRSA